MESGILMKKQIAATIDEIIPVSERIVMVKLEVKPKPVVVIQVYAPTFDSSTEKIKEFYEELENTLKRAKYSDIVFVLGDFNAKVDTNHESTASGRYWLGNGNERWERLLEFAKTHDLTLCNTRFILIQDDYTLG